jgi:hypothetical protein
MTTGGLMNKTHADALACKGAAVATPRRKVSGLRPGTAGHIHKGTAH